MRLALLLAGLASPAAAFSDGPPWQQPAAGCVECHFGAPVREADPALRLTLPQAIEPGATVDLEIRLAVGERGRAGFLLQADAGTFVADGRVETQGNQARSSEAGSFPDRDEAVWRVRWQAPATLAGPVTFVLWANAGNGDDSRLGDQTYRQERTLPPAR